MSQRQPTGMRRGWGVRWIAALACLLPMALMGCGGEAEMPANRLVVAMPSEPTSLDPHVVTDAPDMRVIENLYSTLVRYTEVYGAVEPDLAESWEISEDGLRYTFTLRRGVRFAGSGHELTAEDVLFSIERIRRLGVRAGHFEPVSGMEAPDERTVIFHLSEPSAPFLVNLAYPMNVIVDRRAVQERGDDLGSTAAGTGPFELADLRRGQHILLQRNEDYFIDGLPYLEQVLFRPIPEDATRRGALQRREIDLMIEVSEADRQRLQGTDHIHISSNPGTFWEYVGMNTRRGPLADVRVRQAIAWGIDREVINRMVKHGGATPLIGGHIPEHHWAWADLRLYPQRDVQRARELLADAGHERLALTLKVPREWAPQAAAAQMVQAQLREVGIDITLEALELSQVTGAASAGDFDLVLLGWLGFVDPDEWLYDIFHSEGAYNQHGYSNAEVDELLERGRRIVDQDERREIYTQVQRLIFTEAPVALLYINSQIVAHLDDVEGYFVHPTGTTLWLRQTRLMRR